MFLDMVPWVWHRGHLPLVYLQIKKIIISKNYNHNYKIDILVEGQIWYDYWKIS